MFIQIEDTPNPEMMKFLPGRAVLDEGTAEFHTQDEAGGSPLAAELLALDGVESVFFGHDFITVGKAVDEQWMILKPAVLGTLMAYFASDRPVMSDHVDSTENSGHSLQFDPADKELVDKITALLDERVRPAVAGDGGDITFHGYERGIVYLTSTRSLRRLPQLDSNTTHGNRESP